VVKEGGGGGEGGGREGCVVSTLTLTLTLTSQPAHWKGAVNVCVCVCGGVGVCCLTGVTPCCILCFVGDVPCFRQGLELSNSCPSLVCWQGGHAFCGAAVQSCPSYGLM
jgi:hypothetical protein